jgi:glucan 1,3-beta-glucosidase
VVEKSRRQHKRKKRRVVSGALLEEGDSRRLKGLRGGEKYEEYKYEEYENGKRKKRLCRPPLNHAYNLGY